jgi:hypothetical protein
MNPEVTRKIAVLQVTADALTEASQHFTDTADLLAHRQFQLELAEFMVEQRASGAAPADPIAVITADIERVEAALAGIEGFIKEQLELGREVLSPAPRSLNVALVAEMKDKATAALGLLVERQHKLADAFQEHDITGAEGSLDLAPELPSFCRIRRPESPLLKPSRRDLTQFAHGEGVFHSDVVLHLMGVKTACDVLAARRAEQKEAIEKAHSMAESADFVRAANLLTSLDQVFSDLPYHHITEVLEQWKKHLADVEDRFARLKVQVLAPWRAPFAQPWKVTRKSAETAERLQRFHDELLKFRMSLDDWKNSDYAFEGKRIFKRLSNEQHQLKEAAEKNLAVAGCWAWAQVVLSVVSLVIASQYWRTLWPLVVPIVVLWGAWRAWKWMLARLESRTTVEFRLEANGRPLEEAHLAVIFLNGKPYRSGEHIEAGTYQLTLDTSLFEPVARTVTVALGLKNSLGSIAVKLNRQTFINSLGMRFVPVAGTAAHFSIWPARVQDFAVFAKATTFSWTRPTFRQEPDHPAVNVSWNDAVAFCAWLTEKERTEQRIGQQDTYRLPTDLEWSAAVELGKEPGANPAERDCATADHFPWGKEWPPPKRAGNYDPHMHVDEFDFTSPVGSFKANGQGLHDLGGNVWEWCQDFYNGEQKYRTLRGASWRSAKPQQLLSSARLFDSPGHRVNIIGFRVVLEARRPSPVLQGRAEAAQAHPAAAPSAQPASAAE